MQGPSLQRTPFISRGKPPLLVLMDSLPCLASISRKPISSSCKFSVTLLYLIRLETESVVRAMLRLTFNSISDKA